MNKKAIILGALLLVAGLFVVRAIFFAAPPSGYQTPATAAQANAAAAGASAPADGAAAAAGAGAAEGGQPAGAAAPGASVNLEEVSKNVQVVEFQYDPTSVGRNPMTPLLGPEAIIAAAAAGTGDGTEAKPVDTDLLTQQMAVTGIIWDKKFPVAVINNDVVAPGDVLANGIVVKSIEPDKVVLSVRNQEITLPLKQLEEQ